jgi:hypothetical protein
VTHTANIRALSDRHNETLSEAICRYLDQLAEAHDAVGNGELGGFGTDPSDSAALLKLRSAIDEHLGWENDSDELDADYVGRIKQVGQWVREQKIHNELRRAT